MPPQHVVCHHGHVGHSGLAACCVGLAAGTSFAARVWIVTQVHLKVILRWVQAKPWRKKIEFASETPEAVFRTVVFVLFSKYFSLIATEEELCNLGSGLDVFIFNSSWLFY